MGVAAGQAAEVEHHAVHALCIGVTLHIGVAVQMDLGLQTLLRQQCAGLVDGILLNVKCQNAAALAGQAAQQGGVPAAAGRGINADGTRFYVLPQKFMNKSKCIQLHDILLWEPM